MQNLVTFYPFAKTYLPHWDDTIKLLSLQSKDARLPWRHNAWHHCLWDKELLLHSTSPHFPQESATHFQFLMWTWNLKNKLVFRKTQHISFDTFPFSSVSILMTVPRCRAKPSEKTDGYSMKEKLGWIWWSARIMNKFHITSLLLNKVWY